MLAILAAPTEAEIAVTMFLASPAAIAPSPLGEAKHSSSLCPSPR